MTDAEQSTAIRGPSQTNADSRERTPFPPRLIVAFAATIIVILAGGASFYRSQRQHLEQEARSDLETIVKLKADQIADWRNERLGDVSVFSESPAFRDLTAKWLKEPRPEDAERLLIGFRALAQHFHYRDILLADAEGGVRLSLSGETGPLTPEHQRAVAAVLREGKPALTDLHREAGASPHLHAIAPVLEGDGLSSAPVGAMVLELDAEQFLYPLLDSWPVARQSAETLLVRREGDDVLFLNELRHQRGTALQLRISLARTNVPAVKAVLGVEGIFEGEDYRGVRVLSALKRIPDSPWFMVAKVDVTEALPGWGSRSAMIVAVILGFVLLAGGVAAFLWQRTQKDHYRALLEGETARRRSEEALARAARDWQTTFDAANDAIWLIDQEQRVMRANRAAERMFQQAHPGCAGRRCWEIMHGTSGPIPACPFQRARESLRREVMETQVGEHFVEICVDPIVDDTGRFAGAVHIISDITERKRAETALRESEARLRLALDAAHMGTFDWDVPRNRLDWSGWHEELWGYQRGEFDGTYAAFAGRVHPEDIPGVEAEVTRCMAERVPFLREFRVMWPDGTVHWMASRGEFTFGPQGHPLRMRGVVAEITDRKQAEAIRSRLAAIVDSSNDAIIGMTLDGTVTSWNRSAERLFGYAADEMIGGPITRLIPPERAGEQECLLDLIRRGERVEGFDTIRLRKNGRPLDVSLVLSPMTDSEGRLMGVSKIARDITERKQAEHEILRLNAELEQRVRERTAELESSNRELEAFCYSVSHDLRAPLRGIDGWSHALVEDYGEKLDDQAREYLSQVCAEAQRMGQLIDDLLRLSRVSRGDMRRERVDLSGMAHSILAGLRAREPQRNVEVVIASGLSAIGDPSLLRQVIENLLGNAWKFTARSAPARIEFDLETNGAALAALGGNLPAAPHPPIFRVRDNGAGFDMAHADKLFGPFQRLHRQSEFPGSGIGLATVQRILHRHGGSVWADAQPGRGATFYFILPDKAL